MSIKEAIAKYFHGESKEEKIKRFEILDDTINKSRSEIDGMVHELNTMIAGVDKIKKAANTVINDPLLATPENVAVALDNMRFQDASLSNYMGKFTQDINKLKNDLNKAEAEMVKLIEANNGIANIIIDVKHDENLKKSLAVVLDQYKERNISKADATEAYKNAIAQRRTDMDFESLLNSYLKDN